MSCNKCPVTMCPYLGNAETGSPWTGEVDGDCTPDCGWWDGEGCLGGRELTAELAGKFGIDPTAEWPACPHADECQWQDQTKSHIPCGPRIKVMSNTKMSDTFL